MLGGINEGGSTAAGVEADGVALAGLGDDCAAAVAAQTIVRPATSCRKNFIFFADKL